MTIIDAAVLQFRPVDGDPEANFSRFEELATEHAEGADLIVAPEYMTTGAELAQDVAAESIEGTSVRRAVDLARGTGATIVFGMIERDADSLFNTAVIVSSDGAVVTHRKTHMYPDEAALLGRGDQLSVVQTPAGRLGVMICFEHAFPEIASTLAHGGAEMLVIPTGVLPDNPYGDILRSRARTRAQDNQVYLLLSNYDNSIIVNPRGEVLAEAGPGECVLRAPLDLDLIRRDRVERAMSRWRRPELYAHHGAGPS
jgi:predicted amidohydrolase